MYNRVGSFIARRMRTRLGRQTLGMIGVLIFAVVISVAKAAGWA